MANGAGIDPNSEFMVSYINASKGKNAWAGIDQEISAFAEIVLDETKPEDERIDAKGYLVVCQFKILGHLADLSAEDRIAALSKFKDQNMLANYFGIETENINYQDVFNATRSSAEALVSEHKDKSTYYDKSVLNSAYAVLIKLPLFNMQLTSREERGDALGTTCDEYAKAHLESAKDAARLGGEVGSGRGYVFLRTAYSFMDYPPYSAAIDDEILQRDCKDLRYDCAVNAANMGVMSSHGTLGRYAKESGNLVKAEQEFGLAAEAGFAEFQYELGFLLLFQRDRGDEAKEWLRQAEANEYDVEDALNKEMEKLQEGVPARFIIESGLNALESHRGEEISI